MNWWGGLQILTKQLNAPEYMYEPGLRDQNAIAYLLKRDWGKQRSHVNLVNKQYCLNCYWRDLLDLGDLRSDESRVRSLQLEMAQATMCARPQSISH